MQLIVSKLGPVLNKIVDAFPQQHLGFDIKGKGKAQDEDSLLELQTYLSDWHLIAFIDTIGIFDRVSCGSHHFSDLL